MGWALRCESGGKTAALHTSDSLAEQGGLR
jgi:hypothetical protein